MCAPLAVVAGAQAASALYSGFQQDRQADALNEHQEILHDANVRSARRAALDAFQDLDRRQEMERRRAATTIASVSRQARLAAGAAAAQAEGSAGGSVSALIDEFERQAAEQTGTANFNLRSAEANLQLERRAVRAQEAGRIASTIPNPIPGADWFGIAIGLTSDILGFGLANSGNSLAGTDAGASGLT